MSSLLPRGYPTVPRPSPTTPKKRASVIGGVVIAALVASGIVAALVTHIGPHNNAALTNQVCPGVVKQVSGAYSFAPLHVSSDGIVVDPNECPVPLHGLNMGSLSIADANGGVPRARIAWFATALHTNMVRVNFNSQWWDDDVFVPTANMHYRDWLKLYVSWQEQAGNYVQLDEGPHFAELPCGNGGGVNITFCTAQNQGDLDYRAAPNPNTALELTSNIAPGVMAWQSLAAFYASDPAILYDAWNEPNLTDPTMLSQDMNTLIDTIRGVAPSSLIFVFGRFWSSIVSGALAGYAQANLVMDAHIYDGYNGIVPGGGFCSEPGARTWQPVASGFDANVQYAHAHGQAVAIDEWGGCYDDLGYHQVIVSYAQAQHLTLAYFQAGNLATGNVPPGMALNSNGQLVEAAYLAIQHAIQ